MLRIVSKLLILTLVLILLAGCSSDQHAIRKPAQSKAQRIPGADMAVGISTVTGIAISPLLGTGAVGCWKFWHTDKAKRDSLPWFCHWAVWGGSFLLLALCFIKDIFGSVFPASAKKPFDVAEIFENKFSAGIALIGVIPFLSTDFAKAALLSESGVAFIQSDIGNFLSAIVPTGLSSANAMVAIVVVPVFMAAFLAVWLLSHTINVIIAISPFGLLDFFLKSFRVLLIVSLYLAYDFTDTPWLGTAYSLLIITIAVILFGWAFRLMIYGTVLATDLFFPFISRKEIDTKSPHAFLATRIAGVPVRTFGKAASTSAGRVNFTYRPWLCFKPRAILLPEGRYALSRGLLYPSFLRKVAMSEETLLNFPPRYRGLEDTIAARMGIPEVQDGSFLSGLKRIRRWLREFVGGFIPGSSIS